MDRVVSEVLFHAKSKPDLFLRNSLHLRNGKDEDICIDCPYHDSVVTFSSIENMQKYASVSLLATSVLLRLRQIFSHLYLGFVQKLQSYQGNIRQAELCCLASVDHAAIMMETGFHA